MAQTKEISKHRVVHQDEKSYKTISKESELHQLTIRQIMHKWRTFNIIVTLPGTRTNKDHTKSKACNIPGCHRET